MLRQCFFYLALAMGVVACAPSAQKIGVSASQWCNMTPEQQQALRDRYARLQVWNRQAQAHPLVYQAPPISVSLQQAEAMMPPFEQYYTVSPNAVMLAPGQCQSMRLYSRTSSNHVDMRLCYSGKRLALDASHYRFDQREGTLFFYYNPLWQQGFTYTQVASQGYVRLRHADIHIKTLSS